MSDFQDVVIQVVDGINQDGSFAGGRKTKTGKELVGAKCRIMVPEGDSNMHTMWLEKRSLDASGPDPRGKQFACSMREYTNQNGSTSRQCYSLKVQGGGARSPQDAPQSTQPDSPAPTTTQPVKTAHIDSGEAPSMDTAIGATNALMRKALGAAAAMVEELVGLPREDGPQCIEEVGGTEGALLAIAAVQLSKDIGMGYKVDGKLYQSFVRDILGRAAPKAEPPKKCEGWNPPEIPADDDIPF